MFGNTILYFNSINKSLVWKTNHQSQLSLLPVSYDYFVAAHNPVRIINTNLDNLDVSSIEQACKGGDTSRYHACFLLKISHK